MEPRDLANLIKSLQIPAYGDDEIMFMGETAKLLQPTFVFDWGTNRGSSARVFYEASKMFGYPCEIHTTDLPDSEGWKSPEFPGQDLGLFFRGLPDIHIHRGDGVDESLKVYREKNPSRAIFFVDGDHHYEPVTRELNAIFAGAPTAVILCHDVRHISFCAQAFDDFSTAHANHYHSDKLMSQAGMGRLRPFAHAR